MEDVCRKFSCEFCSANFTEKKNLLRHHRVFHQEQRVLHVCDLCGKAFSRPDSLKRHMKTHQNPNNVKTDGEDGRLTCSQCDAQFIEQKHLDEHVKTHRQRDSYLCHTCGRTYYQREKFMKHLDSHQHRTLPKAPKKRTPEQQGNQAKRRRVQPDLMPIIDIPPYIDPESCAAQVYRERWLDIQDRQSFGRVHRFYNFHLPNLNNESLREKAQKVFEQQSSVFKINASYGFVLCNNETNECRYFYASRNTKVLNEPALVTNKSSFQEFLDTFLKEDVLEYARTLRPNSKWVVQHITNVTFYVFCLTDHPIGQGIDLPAYVQNNQAIVSLVSSRRDGRVYNDNLCLFRCLALFQGEKSEGLETKAKQLLKQYTGLPHVSTSEFSGVRLGHLNKVEEFFKINIMVYELQPVQCSDDEGVTECEKKLADNDNVAVAAKLVRRGLDKFPDTMSYKEH
ncbi:uncharacterized protein [Diadema antillarum]|uniref:uncharacterized protein n=1 Tax=Diadema antillarum TaxID=105358 RepID=UPI003A87ADB9